MKHYDVVIVGAGPAGSTLARYLKEQYSVLLIDKRPLDKEPKKLVKNCGGLIAPDAQKALASFGLSIPKDILVDPQMFSVNTIDFDNNLQREYQRHYINVDRELYDRWLVSLCGDDIEYAFSTRFKSFSSQNGGYIVSLANADEKIEVSTDLIVGADGANSTVKRLLPSYSKESIKRYISIQEWFDNTTDLNEFVAIFDEEISDFYSWIIPKDGQVIFGSAIPEDKDATTYHNLQKEKLRTYGFDLTKANKKEGCFILRPYSSQEINLGEGNIAFVGEAAGFISPTSAEGISYAMLSGYALAKALLTDKSNFMSHYDRFSKKLQRNINFKMLKYPAMYNKWLRKIILGLGIGAFKKVK
ncbi:FAD-binding protein [Sulfurovum sp. zt1-1]|uniref:FAD-binding protein n=1 Tax=Sulfurovum zhangzhouensis TaxID=3019067 RepID=A0ABT7QZW5_9BACT|nr:FAD-binding protein [Sulfurovum zhangzhouensis]MDM5272382.1 FAD-binding protein [Sulfurovum zhangzhouensis]